MKEQPNIDEIVTKLNIPKDKIIQELCNIIKQQMMYGGSLEDKINYWVETLKKSYIL